MEEENPSLELSGITHSFLDKGGKVWGLRAMPTKAAQQGMTDEA